MKKLFSLVAMVFFAVAGWAQSQLETPTYFEIPSSPYVFMTTPENVKGAYMQGWVCTDAASWQTVPAKTTVWYGRWENLDQAEPTWKANPTFANEPEVYGFDGMQVRNQSGVGRKLFMYVKNVSNVKGYFVANKAGRNFTINVYEGENVVKTATAAAGSDYKALVEVAELDATKEYKVELLSDNSNCWVQAVKFEGTAKSRLDTHFYLEQTGNVVKVANKAEGETVRYITGTSGRVTASSDEFPAKGVSFTPGETLDLRVRAFNAEGTGSDTWNAHFELPVPTIAKDYVQVKVVADTAQTSVAYDAWKSVYDNTTDVLWTTTAGDYQYIYKVGEGYEKRTTLTGEEVDLPGASFNRKNTMYFNIAEPSLLKVTSAPYLKGNPATLVSNGTHIQVDGNYYEADAEGNFWVNLEAGVHTFVACKWGAEPGIQMIEIQKGLAPTVKHKIVIDGAETATVEYAVKPGSKYEYNVERAFSYNYVNYDLISFGDSLVGSKFEIEAVTADTTIVVKLGTPITAPDSKLVTYYWKSNYYVTEVGGKMSVGGTTPDVARVNYPNAGNYTVCVSGKAKDWVTFPTLALDKALAAGDTIYVTGYRNKGLVDGAEKAASLTLRANEKTYDTGNAFNDILIDNAKPNLVKIPVTEDFAGATVIDFARGTAGTNIFLTEIMIKTTIANDDVTNAYNDLSNKVDSIANRYAWATEGNEDLSGKVGAIKDALTALGTTVGGVANATDEQKQSMLDEIARIEGLIETLEAAIPAPQVMSEVSAGTYAITMTAEEMVSKVPAARNAWNIGIYYYTGENLYSDDNIDITAVHDKVPVYTNNNNVVKEGYTGYVNAGTKLAQSGWTKESIESTIKSKNISGIVANNQGIVKVTTKKEGYLSFAAHNWSGKRVGGIWTPADSTLVNINAGKTAEGTDSIAAFKEFNNQDKNSPVTVVTAQKVPAGEYYIFLGGNKNIALYQIALTEKAPLAPIANGADLAEYINANAEDIFAAESATVKLGKGSYTMNGNVAVPAGKTLTVTGTDATVTLGESASFVQKGGLVLENLKIDADKNAAALISLATEYNAEDSLANYNSEIGRMLLPQEIVIKNCTINDVHSYLYSDNGKNVVLNKLLIDNSVIKFNTTDANITGKALISATGYGINNLVVTKSTLYNVTETGAKYFVQYNNSARADRGGVELALVEFSNNTFYNTISAGGQFANWSGMKNKTQYITNNNIFFGIKDVARRLIAGGTSGQSTYEWANNTYAYLNGDQIAYDNESNYDKSETALKCDPSFKDAANGDFTIGKYTLQAKNQTGAPKWLVAYDNSFEEVDSAMSALAGDYNALIGNTELMAVINENADLKSTLDNTITPAVTTDLPKLIADAKNGVEGAKTPEEIKALIEKIAGDLATLKQTAQDIATGINAVKANVNNGVVYNMAGQKVESNYRGIVIKNGKKILVK